MALYRVQAQPTVQPLNASGTRAWRCALDMVQGTSKISKGFAHLASRSICLSKPARLGNPEDRL